MAVFDVQCAMAEDLLDRNNIGPAPISGTACPKTLLPLAITATGPHGHRVGGHGRHDYDGRHVSHHHDDHGTSIIETIAMVNK